ncbi:MAG: hypothetical protein HY791_06205 [Deltaproteobacteria bacterium]|nr:hypothetical protein [Deltaproteobacteria bacterium]
MAAVLGCSSDEFCGFSEFDYCTSDTECNASGWARLCATKEIQTHATHIKIACENPEPYDLVCACVEHKCQWVDENFRRVARGE